MERLLAAAERHQRRFLLVQWDYIMRFGPGRVKGRFVVKAVK